MSARPIVRACKNLRRRTLEAASILSLAADRLSFDDYARLEYVMHGASRFSRADLQQEYEILISEQVLRSEDGVICFAGDTLDRLYLKYLARQKGVLGSFAALPMGDAIFRELTRALEIFQDFIMSIYIDLEDTEYPPNIDETVRFFALDRENRKEGYDAEEFPRPAEIFLTHSLSFDEEASGYICELAFVSPLTRLNRFFFWKDADRQTTFEKFKARWQLVEERSQEVGWSVNLQARPLCLPARPCGQTLPRCGCIRARRIR
jgi:hypothetical protein